MKHTMKDTILLFVAILLSAMAWGSVAGATETALEELPDYTQKYNLDGEDTESFLLREQNVYGKRYFRSASPVNNFNYINVFVEFGKDGVPEVSFDDARTKKAVDMVMNSGGINMVSGKPLPILSLQEYVSKLTYGSLNVKSEYFPKTGSSYKTIQSRNYYRTTLGGNTIGYLASDSAESWKREKELVVEIISAVKSEVEKSFTKQQLDINQDGKVDGFNLLIEGYGMNGDVDYGDVLWPHQVSRAGIKNTFHGLEISRYTMNNVNAGNKGLFNYETDSTVTSMRLQNAYYGVIHHEFMHVLGLPDLYRAYSSGRPVGYYDTMANTYNYYPQLPTANMVALLGYKDPMPIITSSTTVTLTKPTYQNKTEKSGVRIQSPVSSSEYFVMEYYDRHDELDAILRDVNLPRSDGLLLSRINTQRTSNVASTSNGRDDFMFIFRPGEVSLGAGQGSLQNAVMLPRVGQTYGRTADESSGGWDKNTLYTTTGQNSGIKVSIVGVSGNSITAKIEIDTIKDIVKPIVEKPDPEPVVNPPKKEEPGITYQTHVQKDGWQTWKSNGEMAGTKGRSLRLEGINVKLNKGGYSGNVSYRTHIESIGWEKNWKSNGAMSGTSGRSLRLEAIEISLSGEIANYYDVYYRVHVQGYGWLGWGKNGEPAGSAGFSKRLEGIEIKLVRKGSVSGINSLTPYVQRYVKYQAHIQRIGWQSPVYDGGMAGTSGRGLRMESMMFSLESQKYSGSIEYMSHIQKIGWESSWKANGAMTGTKGRSLRLEAIKLRLTGEMANHYDIYYRVHAQGYGWLGWAKNGNPSGTSGYGYRLEGIEVRLVQKGQGAPGTMHRAFVEK